MCVVRLEPVSVGARAELNKFLGVLGVLGELGALGVLGVLGYSGY